MEFEIRPMKLNDIDRVYSIELSSHRTPWSREILHDCVLVGYDCRVLERTTVLMKQVIGYIICRNNVNVCHILNLCISSEQQGKGYGKKLLLSVLDSLTNSSTVVLEVRPSNKAALKLYKKLGFKKDLVKKNYYKDNSGEEDAILLKKIILGN
ncbi:MULTISPECIES: ribosomal protein S18-alanine N-acetyltransferase [unclassified Legionella]|uniref:ribosomal protein S18-alanine N-acetyltransferase n=1 Tax=unclassified Legionella TaxID=2622702 RepID=UPI001054759D